MSDLFTFAAATMCCTAVASILPAGGLKRTAALVMGLMVLSAGLGLLRADWPESVLPTLPDSLFEETEGTGLGAAQAFSDAADGR